MESSINMNSSIIEKKECYVEEVNDSCLDKNPNVQFSTDFIPSVNSDNNPTIVINRLLNDEDLTITPAFPNFPTDEEIIIDLPSMIHLQPCNEALAQDTHSISSLTSTSHPSHQKLQLLDELKYLLKPTNSLAHPQELVQESQEAGSAIKYRTVPSDGDTLDQNQRLLVENLTSQEAKSLDAAVRRSNAARIQHPSNVGQFSDQTRALSKEFPLETHSSFLDSPTILINKHEHKTFTDHLSGVIWSLLAAYAHSIIIFITKLCEIDLIFGFFLQMVVQVIAFTIYAIYKDYHLLGSNHCQIAVVPRAILIAIGTLTSFLAYYYVTLPDISAIRQIQVILTIIVSIFIFHERITISRVIACILTLIAIIVLFRPITFGTSMISAFNSTNHKNSWRPYSSTWNHIIGISFAVCTALTYSIASIMNKLYFNAHHLHNTVLCFWSALSGLIISIILVYVTHFTLKDSRSFPYDWRLSVGIGLGLASIFVFIANQKAIKRERSSIVTLIYSTDIILTLILQNLFTHIKSDLVVITGCILILLAVLIICIEVLLMEKRKQTLTIKEIRDVDTLQMSSSFSMMQGDSQSK